MRLYGGWVRKLVPTNVWWRNLSVAAQDAPLLPPPAQLVAPIATAATTVSALNPLVATAIVTSGLCA